MKTTPTNERRYPVTHLSMRRQPTRYAKFEMDWERYEILKQQYTATATTHEEYEAAVRRAVIEAGV